jgi:hypothetical protein
MAAWPADRHRSFAPAPALRNDKPANQAGLSLAFAGMAVTEAGQWCSNRSTMTPVEIATSRKSPLSLRTQ